MYIIIIGGGGVGYELARNLSDKDHDVVVIEKNPEVARQFSETLDVMVIEDNGAKAGVLERAGVKQADMVIAVTQVDEVNIVAAMLAKRYGVPFTVARVRDEEYFDSAVLTREQVGIDMIINPEKAAAQEISKMIHFPEASDVEYFHRGQVMMLGLQVGKEAGITEIPLRNVPLPQGCIVVGISGANDKFIIPSGDDIIQPGDKIYLVGSSKILKDASGLLHHEMTSIRRIVIQGGGMVGLKLAQLLEGSARNFEIALTDTCEERCEDLSSQLGNTLVLKGDATDLSFFHEEEMEFADAIVAVTGDDRNNILLSVLARQLGVKKIIAEVMDPQYVVIYNTLGIDSVINPRLVTASQILRYTRPEDVISLSILKDEKAEVMEVALPESARVAGKRIARAGFPRGMLIGSIVRNGKVIVPYGDTRLHGGDHLIVFYLPELSGQLGRYFAGNGDKKANGKQARLRLMQKPAD